MSRTRLSRRTFLAGTAALAGAALAGGCAAAAASSQFQRVAERSGGRLILPGSPAYSEARLPWNARFDDIAPQAIYRPASAQGVAAAIAACRESDADFAVRCGRHSFAGFSTTNGLVIDMSDLQQVTVDPAAETVTAGAGWANLPLYRQLASTGKSFAGGTCPTVGVVGLAMGGGFGRLSQIHGVTSDTVVRVKAVLADGSQVTVSADSEPELFWALRGCAGGNLAVITEITFRLLPIEAIYSTWSMKFEWDDAVAVMLAWQEWIQRLPPTAHSELSLTTGTPAPTANLSFVFGGDPQHGERVLDELVSETKAKPISRTKTTGPFVSEQMDAYCHGLQEDECAYAGLTATGKLPRGAMTANSDFANTPWPAAGIETTMRFLQERQHNPLLTPREFVPDLQLGKLLMESTGGAVNRIAPTESAFAHRSSLYVATYQARWKADATDEQRHANLDWLSRWYAAVSRWRSGTAYQNYPNPDLVDWQSAYYGQNLDRLCAVKRGYDPDDVFRFRQSIPLNPGD